MNPQLFPKPTRVMRQPRKDSIRFWWQVALAELAIARTPWWWPTFHRIRARLLETDKQTAAMAALERV
jgi:hypothetical protein